MAVIFAIAVLAFYISNFTGTLSSKQEVWGAFGDFIGGTLNPFFSFLALIAILLTIVLQSKELRNSTKELSRSAKALQLQSETLVIQNFENTFFQMIKLHNEILHSIDLRSDGVVTVNGRDCFKTFYTRLSNEYKERLSLLKDKETKLSNSTRHKALQEAFTNFFRKHQSDIGHYFRNLNVILNYIDEAENINKKNYIRIIIAQLSHYELHLLFYDSLFSIRRETMKPLIEKYSLFYHINGFTLFDEGQHLILFDSKAYSNKNI